MSIEQLRSYEALLLELLAKLIGQTRPDIAEALANVQQQIREYERSRILASA